jgi:LysR family glycine cleavage system transcriptional activator
VPGDLLNVPLLHDERQPWSIWFEAVGLNYPDIGQGPRFGDGNLLLPAAIAGLGVALARASLVERDLAAGRLVRLFSRSVPTRYSYFIVYPPGSEASGKIQVFQQWLLEQVRPGDRESPADGPSEQDLTDRTPRAARRRGLAV